MNTKRLILIACVAAASLCAMPLRAQDAHSNPPTQRERFAACARDSTGMKADARQEFMRECLRKHRDAPQASGAASVEASSRGQLAPCNAEADRRKLHGDEREAFVGACVRG
ncbi:MAG TPA: PsiF family protein [Usitatibacter sp.]|nr:PsiF family protein [Usitatibacter sp.]